MVAPASPITETTAPKGHGKYTQRPAGVFPPYAKQITRQSNCPVHRWQFHIPAISSFLDPEEKKTPRMDQRPTPTRICPKCGSGNYAFRFRKKITPEPGQDGPEEMETKYKCKACEHEWKVRSKEGLP